MKICIFVICSWSVTLNCKMLSLLCRSKVNGHYIALMEVNYTSNWCTAAIQAICSLECSHMFESHSELLLPTETCFWNFVLNLLGSDVIRDIMCVIWRPPIVCRKKIYKDTSLLKREKWVLRKSVSLRNPINPQEAWQDISVLGCWRRITTLISGRALLQSCQRVMKKNPPNDKFGFIKVMLSWQEPCFQLALNSPYFITDIFLWPSEWAKYKTKEAEKEDWLSVSLCNLSSAIAFSSSSQGVRNQEDLHTLLGLKPTNNKPSKRLVWGLSIGQKTENRRRLSEILRLAF